MRLKFLKVARYLGSLDAANKLELNLSKKLLDQSYKAGVHGVTSINFSRIDV